MFDNLNFEWREGMKLESSYSGLAMYSRMTSP